MAVILGVEGEVAQQGLETLGVLIDTGIMYALYDRKDPNHLDALGVLLHALKGVWGRVFTTNYVSVEATLLLRSRIGFSAVRSFLGFLGESGISELIVDGQMHRRSVELCSGDQFLSLADAASVNFLNDLKVKHFATFDRRSFARYVAEIIGKGYWESLTPEERAEAERRSRTLHP